MKRALLLLVCIFFVQSAFSFDPPPLEKADAKKIMESMQWSQVTVVAIRQGVDANGVAAPVYATVIGLGNFRGEHHSICQTLFYDKDLDWHFLEMTDRSARVWSKNGYQEIKPWAAW
jgi:hypothetical protein